MPMVAVLHKVKTMHLLQHNYTTPSLRPCVKLRIQSSGLYLINQI